MGKLKILIILVNSILLAASCGEGEIVQRPKKTLDKHTMKAIFYDLSIINALRSFNFKSLSDSSFVPTKYIYKKYGLDSLQLAENIKYYAADVPQMQQIYADIVADIEVKQTLFKRIDSIRDANNAKPKYYGPQPYDAKQKKETLRKYIFLCATNHSL